MKKNKIILYVLVFLTIMLIVFLAIRYFTNYNCKNIQNNNNNNTEIVNEDIIAKYNNYEYLLPGTVYYEVVDKDNVKILHLYTNADMWGAYIKLLDREKYDRDLFTDYDKLETILKNNARRIENKKVTVRGNSEVVSFEDYHDEYDGLLAYMLAYDSYEYEIMVYDGDDKTMNYDALNMIIDILSNGKKVEE